MNDIVITVSQNRDWDERWSHMGRLYAWLRQQDEDERRLRELKERPIRETIARLDAAIANVRRFV